MNPPSKIQEPGSLISMLIITSESRPGRIILSSVRVIMVMPTIVIIPQDFFVSCMSHSCIAFPSRSVWATLELPLAGQRLITTPPGLVPIITSTTLTEQCAVGHAAYLALLRVPNSIRPILLVRLHCISSGVLLGNCLIPFVKSSGVHMQVQ